MNEFLTFLILRVLDASEYQCALLLWVFIYVSGGTAVLPTTALMLAVPAHIAGCKIVVLATPPGKDGSICKAGFYCAKKAGLTHVLKAGGAQAVSAMVWGTSSCPKVEKFLDLEINMSQLQK
ncbi:hypothetical protein MKW92_050069 [Papaver armeniacum]|nr:hypothetical protein MKW92_050069 [Papaver armeniacum]